MLLPFPFYRTMDKERKRNEKQMFSEGKRVFFSTFDVNKVGPHTVTRKLH